MKKTEYMAPEMEVVKISVQKFLCGSDPSEIGGGVETGGEGGGIQPD